MKRYKILAILFVLTILIFGSGITYSFFQSNVIMDSVDRNIAKFVFNTEQLNEIELSLIDLNPGDVEEYQFSVSNTKAGLLSNVSVEYQMIIKTYHLVPLLIELYKLDGETEELILTCDETYTRNLDNELICNSPIQEMSHSLEKLDNYKIKIEFPEEYNDVMYAGLVDYINIEIKSWQKMEE